MSSLAIKEVDFKGDLLKTAHNKSDDKIYVGISGVCNGLGFNKNQKDRQVKNIQGDEVLKRGCVKFDAGVFDADNETFAIELDFLPLWLAKISITPNMKKNNPDIVVKLVDYQLKAKEVLANAFVRNVTQIVPQTYKDALYALIESIEEKEKLEEENKILLPKAESFDDFIDGSNVQNMNTVAKALGYGRNKPYKFLREQKVLMKGNLPYQSYIDRGYFKVKEVPVVNDNIRFNKTQTFVTAKGVDFINKLLKEHNVERDI